MRTVGGYTLGRLIARGAHGSVFEAVHENVASRRVAVKLLDTRDQDEKTVERFIRESEILGRVDHPNVVRVHSAGIAEEGAIFIAMELVQGSDLGKLLERGASADEACRWLLGAARGLSALHAQGIVHRDVKPENILVSHEGTAKICDLGVARDVNRQTILTAAGDVIGTFDYMSPEQATGATVDARTDVFGLGAVLYRILAGRPPYEARTAIEALRLASFAAPPRPGGSPILESLCLRAMSREPAKRPADAGAFADELERALVATPSEERVERVRLIVRRAQPVFMISLLVAALLAVAWVVFRRGGIDELARASAHLEAVERAARTAADALRRGKDVESASDELERALGEAAAVASAAPTREVEASWDRALGVAAEAALVAGEPRRARARAAELASRAPQAASFLLAAQVELCLEEPAASWEWLAKPDDAKGPEVAIVRAATRFALARDLASVAAVASDVEAALPPVRGPIALLAAEAFLAAGDARAGLAWTERGLAESAQDPAALAIAGEAHIALGDLEAARLDVRRAEERLASARERSALFAIPSAEERVARARGALLLARGERHAAAEALGRAQAASVGRRAGRLALRRAEILSEGGDRGGAEDPLHAAEKTGLGLEAALQRARNRFAQGDAAGARRVAASAGAGRAAVLLRARLAILALALEPGPEASQAAEASRAELATLAARDGDAAALLSWLDAGAHPTAHEGGAEALVLAAHERLDGGDETGAALLLRRARALVPGSFAHEVGALAVGTGRFGGSLHPGLVGAAREWLRAAPAASLADADALVLLARLERLDDHAQRALAWAGLACRAGPLDPRAWLEQGLAALASGPGERDRARRSLETAARLAPSPDPEALVGLIRLSLEEREEKRAEALAAALLAGPSEPGLLDALAFACGGSEEIARLVAERRAREEHDEAAAGELDQLAFKRQEDLEACDRAWKLSPTPRRLLARASAHARIAQYIEALLDEATAALLSGEGVFPLFERSRSVAVLDGAEARRRADQIGGDGSDPAHALARAALIFASDVGRERDKLGPDKKARLAAWSEGRDALEGVWAREPARASLWALRAVYGRAVGREEEPERDLLFARAAGLEAVPSVEYLLARVSAATGDRRAAIAHLDLAIKGGFVHDRVHADLDAGAEGWFGNDAELRKRLEQLVR